ncbi:hypothetical protein C7974DRAFT_396687 [Boeremia exigua]|uniref:uncharacterized protein n=1 Tax=Boeremia exigua TaxID=749465 RepID=UPI001E8D8137|nr:uncharacterized protein C7974DRAFT_396687 [Boeremia exigua]KAH6625771.1 hypothetical protein C7974DRAFT_396687 [Boeremia exigua]
MVPGVLVIARRHGTAHHIPAAVTGLQSTAHWSLQRRRGNHAAAPTPDAMESAHLTTAHEHVRNAQTATLSSSIATAGDEHDHAAAFFRDAAQDTHNAEALRILSLLEDHHRKLAALIKEAPRKTARKTTASSTAKLADSATAASTAKAAAARTSSPSPRTHRRLPQPSIASNLAEKRGIPSARRTTSGNVVTVAGANAPRDGQATPVRDLLERQARKADLSRSRELAKQQEAPPPSSPPPEDNFRRFYSAFGGVISAISAPLAFTSLPLNPVPPTPAPPPAAEKASRAKSRNSSPEASRTVKSSVPDLAALISKPALRALRSDGGTPLNPNESFYLVPTSGGTVTYASMLQGSASQPHHLNPIDEGSGSLKGSQDEFVDAQESVGPPSPTTARRPRSRSSTGQVTAQRTIAAGRGAGLKTLEELALENETLKSLVDNQAKRIQMWETNSQNQFTALAQSFRTRPQRDPNAPAHAHGPNTLPAPLSPPIQNTLFQPPLSPDSPSPSSAPSSRIAELEAQLAAQSLRLADLGSTNAQLARQTERDRQVIGRYRDQWEKLKAGARKKEVERRERRVNEVRAGEAAKDSESGDAGGEGEEGADEVEADFGKA